MKYIAPNELKKLLDDKKVVLIDVRSDVEYDQEHISGAQSIPLDQIDTFDPLKEKVPVVLYCLSGKRSETACQKLLDRVKDCDVTVLKGGILFWKECGNAIQSHKNNLPLMRQVQISVGTITLAGVILGTLFHPIFYSIPALAGAGLIFAGVTGSCGMAMLLAKMPWNR
jgi:rhodanese-related sulfurtransferase